MKEENNKQMKNKRKLSLEGIKEKKGNQKLQNN